MIAGHHSLNGLHSQKTFSTLGTQVCANVKEGRCLKIAAEKNFEEKVKKYLDERNDWHLKYWGGGGFTKSGIPDLLVCDCGRFLGIELKADNGKPSLLQLYNLKKIREAGGIGVLLYPKEFEQFKEFNKEKYELDAWYLANIEEQKRWEIKLKGD